MKIFRIFFVSVLIPLISVGLCAVGEGKLRVQRTTISQVQPRNLENASINSTIHFPSHLSHNKSETLAKLEPRRSSSSTSNEGSSPEEHQGDSLPYHPHPLKIQIKSIKNSTRADGEDWRVQGRSLDDYSQFSDKIAVIRWVIGFLWKAFSSYMFVGFVNFIFALAWKKFGYGAPSWDIGIKLAKKEHESHEGDGHQGHPGGHYGQHGQHGGWGGTLLSYDQHLALPFQDKASRKAHKKYQKYVKKAQKFAAKASHYAQKAHLAKLQSKPLSPYEQASILSPHGQHHQGYGRKSNA